MKEGIIYLKAKTNHDGSVDLKLKNKGNDHWHNQNLITDLEPGSVVKWEIHDKSIESITEIKGKKEFNIFSKLPAPEKGGTWSGTIKDDAPASEESYNIGFKTPDGKSHIVDPTLKIKLP